MRATAAPVTLRIDDPAPFGDMPLAPPELTGMSQAELARSMADYLLESSPGSDAQALQLLRQVFPYSPLTTRVAALAALMRR
jgi:hypothetical protein